MTFIRERACVLLLVLAAAPAVSFADDPLITGTVTQMFTDTSLSGAPGAADFRIQMGGQTFCTGAASGTFAFVNSDDANYKAVVSIVEMAVALGKPLTVSSRLSPLGSLSLCKITSVQYAN